MSARKRKDIIDEIADRFAALPVQSQDGLLITLNYIHRAAKREADKTPLQRHVEQMALTTPPTVDPV